MNKRVSRFLEDSKWSDNIFQAEFLFKTLLNFWILLRKAHNQIELKTKPHLQYFVLQDDSLNVPTTAILSRE